MISEFRITCGKRINLGDYNSIQIEASITWVLDNDDLEAAKAQAQRELRLLLEETYKSQRKAT